MSDENVARVKCGICGKTIKFPVVKVGKVVKCPSCGEVLKLRDESERQCHIEVAETPGNAVESASQRIQATRSTATNTLMGCMLTMVFLCAGCAGLGWFLGPSEEQIAAEKADAERLAINATLKTKLLADESLQKREEALRANAEELAKKQLTDERNLRLFTEQLTALEVSGVAIQLVDGNNATLVVSNTWHFLPYQLRLQSAQNLWAVWARVASPLEVDHARITLKDVNGNKVGGSQVWGGSLIWVNEK